MGLTNLSQLYREVILDHAKNPRNLRKLADATHQVELLNPTCGDAIIVELRVENNCIVEVGYTGHGCSISQSSASMMTEVIKGLTLEEAQAEIDAFNQLIKGETIAQAHVERLKDAYFLEGVKQFPARYKLSLIHI